MNSAEMPKYTCHKIVHALKIQSIHTESDGEVTLFFDPPFAAWKPDGEFILINPKLEAGGYLVVYQDGYRSFSPQKAFEEGYTRITTDPAS
jgi:hypothetical protein